MNAAHFHLLVNHFPVIGVIIGFLVLTAGFLLKKAEVKQVAFGIFVFTAMATIPAFFSGEAAEEVLEQYPGFEETYVEEHEETALWAIILVEILGVVAAISLFFFVKNNPLQNSFSLATLIIALAAIATVARTNNTGGEIRHPEIRNSSAGIQQQETGSGENDKDDD